MHHCLQVYWSQSLSSEQRVVVSSRFQQEGVYLVWGSPGRTAWGKRRLFWKQPYWKTLISQIKMWKAWFHSRWEYEQIWRTVMSLFCPHCSLKPVTPGMVQRKGKPAFPTVLATWHGMTKGWESSSVVPMEHCLPALCPAKWHEFWCWTSPCVGMKNYLQLSLYKNWDEACGRIPFIFQHKNHPSPFLCPQGCGQQWLK